MGLAEHYGKYSSHYGTANHSAEKSDVHDSEDVVTPLSTDTDSTAHIEPDAPNVLPGDSEDMDQGMPLTDEAMEQGVVRAVKTARLRAPRTKATPDSARFKRTDAEPAPRMRQLIRPQPKTVKSQDYSAGSPDALAALVPSNPAVEHMESEIAAKPYESATPITIDTAVVTYGLSGQAISSEHAQWLLEHPDECRKFISTAQVTINEFKELTPEQRLRIGDRLSDIRTYLNQVVGTR